MVDDGDGDHYNASVSLEGRQLLQVDTEDGVHVGGAPELVGVTVKIHEDYFEGESRLERDPQFVHTCPIYTHRTIKTNNTRTCESSSQGALTT